MPTMQVPTPALVAAGSEALRREQSFIGGPASLYAFERRRTG
jgi:hypothetical protein